MEAIPLEITKNKLCKWKEPVEIIEENIEKNEDIVILTEPTPLDYIEDKPDVDAVNEDIDIANETMDANDDSLCADLTKEEERNLPQDENSCSTTKLIEDNIDDTTALEVDVTLTRETDIEKESLLNNEEVSEETHEEVKQDEVSLEHKIFELQVTEADVTEPNISGQLEDIDNLANTDEIKEVIHQMDESDEDLNILEDNILNNEAINEDIMGDGDIQDDFDEVVETGDFDETLDMEDTQILEETKEIDEANDVEFLNNDDEYASNVEEEIIDNDDEQEIEEELGKEEESDDYVEAIDEEEDNDDEEEEQEEEEEEEEEEYSGDEWGDSVLSEWDDEDPFYGCGQVAGVEVWKITHMQAVPLKEEAIGRFKSGSVYVVLSTMGIPGDFVHTVFLWIGSNAKVDTLCIGAQQSLVVNKRFNDETPVSRITDGSESYVFKSLFDLYDGFQRVEHKAETSLVTKKNEFEPIMYRIKGRNKAYVSPIRIDIHSLSQKDCCLLDMKDKIYVFYGELASKAAFSTAMQLAQQIKNVDRRGQCEVITVDTVGHDDDDFWEILGGKKEIQFSSRPSDRQYEEMMKDSIRMMEILLENDEFKLEPIEVKRENMASDRCYIFNCGFRVYVWRGRYCDELIAEAASVSGYELVKVWYPDEEEEEEGLVVNRFEEITEGLETGLFRSFFSDFDECVEKAKRLAMEEERKRILEEKKEEDRLKALKAIEDKKRLLELMQKRKERLKSSINTEECLIETYRLVDLKVEAVDLPDAGKFHSRDCYVVCHCEVVVDMLVYTVFFWQGKHSPACCFVNFFFSLWNQICDSAMERGSPKPDLVQIKQGQETVEFLSLFQGHMVVYNGGKSSKWLRQVEDGYYWQQQYLLNELILSEPQSPSKPRIPAKRLFQVIGHNEYECRAIEVEYNVKSLCPNSSYILELTYPSSPERISKELEWMEKQELLAEEMEEEEDFEEEDNPYGLEGTIYLWHGQGTSKECKKISKDIVVSLFIASHEFYEFDEGNETHQFWADLDYDTKKIETDDMGTSIKPYYSHEFLCDPTIAPRFFQLYITHHEPTLVEINSWSQQDLEHNNVIIIDTLQRTFVWNGKYSSEELRKLGMDLARDYINNSDDGRALKPPLNVMENEEPGFFKALFRAWDEDDRKPQVLGFVDPCIETERRITNAIDENAKEMLKNKHAHYNNKSMVFWNLKSTNMSTVAAREALAKIQLEFNRWKSISGKKTKCAICGEAIAGPITWYSDGESICSWKCMLPENLPDDMSMSRFVRNTLKPWVESLKF
eukprot:TRINITY_DN3231_c3_g1_i3.p1 TRINITY_DN3231_c3_g1~~TRINITY_DN3231_c3_g1_i3.p1  ORF type:complete len:1410 (+),score=456.28 TRINITY_DN3231_c3_g1_i3:382-4230(+)